MEISTKNEQTILETIPFSVSRKTVLVNREPLNHPFHTLSCPDWMNVAPVTADNELILVKQPRIGTMSMTLETPAGVVEESERSNPSLTAARELEEETGYRAVEIVPLGSFLVNPAIQNNAVHLYLAKECKQAAERQHFPDANERIEVIRHPLESIPDLLKTGEINHSLSVLCIHLALQHMTSR